MRRLTNDECLQITGQPLSHFIELTGIKGVYPNFDPATTPYYLPFLSGNFLTIQIRTNELELARSIDYINKNIINNVMQRIDGVKGGKFGKKLLSSQIDFAEQGNYQFLYISAHREPNDTDWIGYKLWSDYGYYMIEPSYTNVFRSFMKSFSIKERTIFELQISEDGRKLWDEKGDTWSGEFDLKPGSYSRTLFSKKINA